MSVAKCTDLDYIDYLIPTPRIVTCTEAARVQPPRRDAPAHDAFSRLLDRPEPDPEAPWQEARPMVRRRDGVLILDDSTLGQPYASEIPLVGWHWSGTHRDVVRGINRISVVGSDGDHLAPGDYRISDKARDGLTQDDHFRAMPATAAERGFQPRCILFDEWYASPEDLKAVREWGGRWLTQLEANRLVNPDASGLRPVRAVGLAPSGTIVPLPGSGRIQVFPIVAQDGRKEYWATNDLERDELERLSLTERIWAVED
jgi:putative transposase